MKTRLSGESTRARLVRVSRALFALSLVLTGVAGRPGSGGDASAIEGSSSGP